MKSVTSNTNRPPSVRHSPMTRSHPIGSRSESGKTSLTHQNSTSLAYFQRDFRLSRRERSILSRNDLIQLEGIVAKVLGGGSMEIQCENSMVVRGVLSGRMKKHRIKVMVGDKVQVSVSPYDTSHGLITYRF